MEGGFNLAIYKYVTLTIKGTSTRPSEKVFIYQGDFGIDFYFALESFNYDITENNTRGMRNILTDLQESAYVGVTMLSPAGEMISRDRIPIESGQYIKFTITKDLTDDLSDIGEYKLQFHLYDSDGETANRVTIPPFSFEVKGLLE